jgi:hypothetical protein
MNTLRDLGADALDEAEIIHGGVAYRLQGAEVCD